MCCDRINTDTLLANLFASGRRNYYTFEELSEYYNCLLSSSAMYLASDFCEDSVRQCADRYPTLFRAYEDAGHTLVVYSGSARPNLQFFNAAYSVDMRDYIQRITEFYVSRLLKNEGLVGAETYELAAAAN